MTDISTDVVIVGGGPAGLCAGIVLAREGVRTVICERRSYPVDKVCGQGIMPTGVADLYKIGINRHLQSDDLFEFKGISYISRSGTTATSTFSEGPGWGIRRPVLSEALYRCATETPGLTLKQETGISGIDFQSGQPVVQTDRGEVITTRLVIGADGRNSKVRRWTGLDGPLQKLRRWGARQHFRMRPWSEFVEVHWGDGIEAYVTPCGHDLVEIAFLWDQGRYRSVSGGASLMPGLFASFPELKERVEIGESNDDVRAIGPLCHAARSPVGDGVLLIGDAAGYLDAITGEGISLATAQAASLIDTVAPLLRSNPTRMPSARDLQSYRTAYRKIVTPYYMLTRMVLFLSRHPRLAERAIKTLNKRPDVFQTLLSINMGNIPTLPRLSATAMRLLSDMITSEVIPGR